MRNVFHLSFSLGSVVRMCPRNRDTSSMLVHETSASPVPPYVTFPPAKSNPRNLPGKMIRRQHALFMEPQTYGEVKQRSGNIPVWIKTYGRSNSRSFSWTFRFEIDIGISLNALLSVPNSDGTKSCTPAFFADSASASWEPSPAQPSVEMTASMPFNADTRVSGDS